MSSAAPMGGARTVSERKLPVRGTAPRSEAAHDIVARAFELVYFIHRDRQAALRVVASALMKLDVATARQDKRLYYNPTGRFGRPRTKVVVDRPQLLQRLLMIESEPLERATEASGAAERDDLLIHFLKELVRITVKRNSFYVTLGTSRLLHNYTTAETMHVYDALGADPVHVRDDSYYRSRKAQLMSEIQERFGKLLTVVRSPRGEDRFRSRGTTSRERELIHEAMSLLTPWGTVCPGKSGHTGIAGEDPMDDEISRFHTILHSTCYERLTSSLDLPEPDSRLEVPQFERESDDKESRDRRVTLLDEERNQLESMLDNASRKRRGVSVWRVRVVVDGVDRVTFDPSDGGADLSVAEDAELIELVSGQGDQAVVLATHLLTHDQEAVEGITVEGGQQITMHVSPARDGGAHLAIAYRQRGWADLRTRLSRWATGFLKVAAPVTAAVALAFLALQPNESVTPPPAAPATVPVQAPAVIPEPVRAIPAPASRPTEIPPAVKPLTRGVGTEAGVSLARVKTIWIAGDQGELANALAESLGGRWSVIDSPDEADAALKISELHAGAFRVRLVNAAGSVLWPPEQEGRVYEGDFRAVAERITAELIAASARH